MRQLLGSQPTIATAITVLLFEALVPLNEEWTIILFTGNTLFTQYPTFSIRVNGIEHCSFCTSPEDQVVVLDKKVSGGNILSLYGTNPIAMSVDLDGYLLIDRKITKE